MNNDSSRHAPVNGKTKVIVLIAWPADHIRTPTFFNTLCAERGINAAMVPWAVRPEHLADAWNGLRFVDNLAGVVLTIPHKQTAAALCDSLEGDAALLDVVNTVRRNADGTYTGRMYDGVGFVDGLRNQGVTLDNQRALLLGAGGAATAIALALARAGVSALTIANRSPEKAQQLVQLVRQHAKHAKVEAGSADPAGHDIVINATSLGLKEGDALPCDAARIESGMVVAEAVMQPPVTPLLSAAAKRGARTHLGEHMVTAQLERFVEFLLNTEARH
ncbi:shikimate dehydrogenase family protein [Paraburkholderia terrae]|uniref:shikimate dehydrogenase family protein n=1 Tax=Paraburkholderia terrae TaxID=311230 RepID=UPI002058222B|nr:shikimate dehydrogenase [Paraburkholderia terrae]BDC45926.1 shikimate dehydrogenase [Paraburkholderia terrae]